MPRALVIGSTKGIGAAIATRLKDEGFEVTGLSRYTSPSLDLRWRQQEIRRAVRRASHPRLDLLVISAGAGAYTYPIESEEKIRSLMDTNYTGRVLAFQAALKPLIRSQGQAVFIGSAVASPPGASGLSHYAAAMGALNSWVISEARRVRSRGIRMNVVAPGWVDTEMTREIEPDIRQKILDALPDGRMGTPEEVADVVMEVVNDPDGGTGQIIERVGIVGG